MRQLYTCPQITQEVSMSVNNDAAAPELYRRRRPRKFSEMVGQDEAVNALQTLGKDGKIPHALLFTGPSGVGKTTAARIIKSCLKCHDNDFFELNSAEARGIDDIRAIQSRMSFAPIGGKCRIWLLDETHKVSSDGQNCMLKMLEDTPKHVYFILASSEPGKLIKAIKTRCTEIKFKAIPAALLEKLVMDTAVLEQKPVDKAVAVKIASIAEGSGRAALVMLHQVIGLPGKDAQLNGLEKVDVAATGFNIAQALLKKVEWKEVAAMLKQAEDQDPEAIRRVVLGYMQSVLRGGAKNKRAWDIIECFRPNTFDIGMPGVVASCFEACCVI